MLLSTGLGAEGGSAQCMVVNLPAMLLLGSSVNMSIFFQSTELMNRKYSVCLWNVIGFSKAHYQILYIPSCMCWMCFWDQPHHPIPTIPSVSDLEVGTHFWHLPKQNIIRKIKFCYQNNHIMYSPSWVVFDDVYKSSAGRRRL